MRLASRRIHFSAVCGQITSRLPQDSLETRRDEMKARLDRVLSESTRSTRLNEFARYKQSILYNNFHRKVAMVFD